MRRCCRRAGRGACAGTAPAVPSRSSGSRASITITVKVKRAIRSCSTIRSRSRPGQLVVMTGPSGAGKTTLLTLIGALRSVQEGRIEVLGRDLSRLGAARARRGAARHRLHLSDAQSVRRAFRLRERQDGGAARKAPSGRRCADAAAKFCERLGLGHRIDYKPRYFSGGERQRVAIGRALVNRPRLILADEPTAALDRESTMNVIGLLKPTTVEHGAAVMMVTHDHRIIDSADRLVHMVDGRIMSDVVLHDALRICEFLRAVELFRTLTPRSSPMSRKR